MSNPTPRPLVARNVLPALQALADESRLRILTSLRAGERCVCELQSSLGMGQSLLSHHLRSLREAGLVRDRREGRWVHYSIATESLRELEQYLCSVRTNASDVGLAGGA